MFQKYVDYSLYHLFILTRFLISGEVFSFSNFLSVRRCGRFFSFFSLLSCVSSTHISGMRCSSSSIYSNKGPGVFNFALSFCYTRTKSRSMSNLTHQKTHCSEEDSLFSCVVQRTIFFVSLFGRIFSVSTQKGQQESGHLLEATCSTVTFLSHSSHYGTRKFC